MIINYNTKTLQMYSQYQYPWSFDLGLNKLASVLDGTYYCLCTKCVIVSKIGFVQNNINREIWVCLICSNKVIPAQDEKN